MHRKALPLFEDRLAFEDSRVQSVRSERAVTVLCLVFVAGGLRIGCCAKLSRERDESTAGRRSKDIDRAEAQVTSFVVCISAIAATCWLIEARR